MTLGRPFVFVFAFFGLVSCSYYAYWQTFNQHFESGKIKEANAEIDRKRKTGLGGNSSMLYCLNKGVVSFMLGERDTSNAYFEKAYLFKEDYVRNPAWDALGFVYNPTITPYVGEDFEVIYLHYYKILNFLQMARYDYARVEAKRLEIKLERLNETYKNANKYRDDGFLYVLMGLVYEANDEDNNAYVAYKKAYQSYKESFGTIVQSGIPNQLKNDLVRLAYQLGFDQDLDKWEKEFGIVYSPKDKNKGELLFIWQNGLGPVKIQWSLNFLLNRNMGMVYFVNNDFGLAIPFPITDEQWESLKYVGSLRIAFPKYVERPLVYSAANMVANNQTFPLQKVSDINAIAIKQLNDRMLLEVGQGLLRVALKKAGEIAIKKQNQYVGLGMEIYDFISEQADTRNWQTLPHDIYYVRIPLAQGEQLVSLRMDGSQQNEQKFTFNIIKGQTTYGFYHALEHVPVAIDGF